MSHKLREFYKNNLTIYQLCFAESWYLTLTYYFLWFLFWMSALSLFILVFMGPEILEVGKIFEYSQMSKIIIALAVNFGFLIFLIGISFLIINFIKSRLEQEFPEKTASGENKIFEIRKMKVKRFLEKEFGEVSSEKLRELKQVVKDKLEGSTFENWLWPGFWAATLVPIWYTFLQKLFGFVETTDDLLYAVGIAVFLSCLIFIALKFPKIMFREIEDVFIKADLQELAMILDELYWDIKKQ